MSSSGVTFTNVTAEAGLSHVQGTVDIVPESGPNDAVYNIMSGGAAAGDFDGDGYVDLYFTLLDGSDILYRNLGDGTFEDVTAEAGIARGNGSNGAGWADIDNDGDLDLYVTSVYDTRFYLYINDGTGHFTEQAIERGAAVEGAIGNYGMSVSFGDYDLDGYLDISTTEWLRGQFNPTGAPANNRLLHNLGAEAPGFFEDVTVAAGVEVDNVGELEGAFGFATRWADLDNDGLLDLTLASDFTTSRLFWNNGDGTFTDGTVAAGVGTDNNGMGSAIGDVNGDGLLDWFVTAIWQPGSDVRDGNRLYLNNGDRTFTDVTIEAGVRDGGWGWGATFIDYDNDGDLDLAHTNGWPVTYADDQTRFFENDGTGHFTLVSTEVGITDTGEGKGLLKLDYDNDGDQDLLVVNNKAGPVLYRNDGGNANDWLRLKTFGPEPGVGAFITLTSDGVSQVREINADSNFLGQDEATVHFGLGAGAGPVEEVLIDWLVGEVQTLTDVPRNTTVSIARGGSDDVYSGGAGRDWIEGGAGDDHLAGEAGSDILIGGGGDDLLDGGTGFDVARYGGLQDDYVVTTDGGAMTVLDLSSGALDHLTGIEALAYADGLVIGAVPIYRLLDTNNGNHLLTADQQEYEALIAADGGFVFEGEAFTSVAGSNANTLAVWRLFDLEGGQHLYTSSEAERDHIIETYDHFQLDGLAFEAYATAQEGTVALYRFFDPASGSHVVTASEAEREAIESDLPQFQLEGILGYVDPGL
ncbi:MAG: FG-GAP-like repeat-containing protein [Pseudomonadota bacterium]